MANEFRAANNTEVLLLRILNQLAGSASAGSGTPGGGDPYTTIDNGRTVVATPGTAVALAASTTIKMVTIQAELSNTGAITVGTTTVDGAEPTRQGIALESGDTMTLEIDDLAKVYIDAEVATEGVTFIYVN